MPGYKLKHMYISACLHNAAAAVHADHYNRTPDHCCLSRLAQYIKQSQLSCPVLSCDDSKWRAFCLQAPPQANGTIPFYTQLSLELLSDKEDFVMQLLAGGLQDNSCIVCSMVVAVQVPKTG